MDYHMTFIAGIFVGVFGTFIMLRYLKDEVMSLEERKEYIYGIKSKKMATPMYFPMCVGIGSILYFLFFTNVTEETFAKSGFTICLIYITAKLIHKYRNFFK